MCGLIFAKSLENRDISALVMARYLKQKDRGADAFGFYLPGRDKLVHNLREGRIMRLMEREKSNEVLFHHRLPTSTGNIRRAAHPFSTKKYFKKHSYVMIHNGRITNSYALQRDHETRKIKYVSEHVTRSPGYNYDVKAFNDSESLMWELALYLEGRKKTMDAYGSIAFIMVQLEKGKPRRVFFARNTDRPLKLTLEKTFVEIASTGAADDIPVNTLHIYDYLENTLTVEPLKLPTTYWEANPTVPATSAAPAVQGEIIPVKRYYPLGWKGSAWGLEGHRHYRLHYLDQEAVSYRDYLAAMAKYITEESLKAHHEDPREAVLSLELELEKLDEAWKDESELLARPRYREYTRAIALAIYSLESAIEQLDAEMASSLSGITEDEEAET